jgi:hypothetical protein
MKWLFPRVCCECGRPFFCFGVPPKTCGERCRLARRAKGLAAYYKSHRGQKAKAEAYRRDMEAPARAEARRASNRASRAHHSLESKVASQWKVSTKQARAWIAAGSFPP